MVSYSLRGNAQTKHLELHLEWRKCLHFYFYVEHPKFGFMHLRLQSWFPFPVDFCLNGRHWLARQLDEAGVAYRKRENCLVWVEDTAKAQELLDQQVRTKLAKELGQLLQRSHPSQADRSALEPELLLERVRKRVCLGRAPWPGRGVGAPLPQPRCIMQ